MSIFDEAKERVSMDEAARFYGFHPNRAGFICCPFHSEKTPSLKLYDRGWKCFGCGEGGSVIDFTARLHGLTPIDAVRRLNADFQLSLDLNGRQPPSVRTKRERLKERYEAFIRWEECFLILLDAVYRRGFLALKEGPNEEDEAAIRWMDTAAYYSDMLLFGRPEEQAQIYREREVIGRWIDEALRP